MGIPSISCSNTYISVSEIRKFFFIFLDAVVEMRYEYVYLPWDIDELRNLIRDYAKQGLPGCCTIGKRHMLLATHLKVFHKLGKMDREEW